MLIELIFYQKYFIVITYNIILIKIKTQQLLCLMVRLTYKPSSVFDNHLSRIIVANNLKRFSDWRATKMSFSLASDGVYITTKVAFGVVSFYLAVPPLHYKIMRYISVALSLESPPLVISQHPALWCSDFPHM